MNNQYIEYNQYIQIDNKPIIIQPPLKTLANIKIGDIVNSIKSIMTHTELTNKYKLVVDPWGWMAIISAIPKEWKKKIKKECQLQKCLNSLNTNDAYIIINNKYKLVKSKEIYQSLVNENIQSPISVEKLINIFPFMETTDWSK